MSYIECSGRATRMPKSPAAWAGTDVHSDGIVEVVRRNDLHRFVVLPRRWVVERTFGWLGKYRRLSKDYETLPYSSETMIYLAMINLMIHRLKPG